MLGAVYKDHAHGKDKELAVGFTPYLVGFSELLKETLEAIGYPYNEDANDGIIRGFNTWPMTPNETGPVREDAARAFYFPVAESRPNLHVLLNTTAARIMWDESDFTSNVTATGVKVITAENVTETTYQGSYRRCGIDQIASVLVGFRRRQSGYTWASW
jgi:choline dehydrogenase-like flavoprotein